jgi:hypothetical protein
MPGSGIIQLGRMVVEFALIVSLFFLLQPMYNANGQQRWPKLGKVKFYTKQELDVGQGWTAGAYKSSFLAKCAPASSKIYNSDACACVRAKTTDKEVQQCLLHNDIPLQIGDGPGFLLIIPLAVWFMASASAQMLSPFYGYPAHGEDRVITAENNTGWKILRQGYIVGVLMVLLLPILLYNLTPNKDHFDAMSSALYFILFTVVTLVSTVVVSFETAYCTLNPMNAKVATVDGDANVFKAHLEGHMYLNWAFYAHVLVSAPCIAVVAHILNENLEFSSLCNTALLLCAIFALDGFSHFVAIYWVAVINHDTGREGVDNNLNRTVALIKLFSWGTQAFLVLLFFITEYVKYSSTADMTSTPPHAVTAMILVVLVLMNLVPDVVREFMDFDYLFMIAFRYFGDLLLRIGVFWYITYLLSVKVQ